VPARSLRITAQQVVASGVSQRLVRNILFALTVLSKADARRISGRTRAGMERGQISISLQAVPSFEAFGRFLQAANAFAFLGAGCADGVVSLARNRERSGLARKRRLSTAGA